MKTLVTADKLPSAIYDYEHPTFCLGDDDIDTINNIIIKGFAEEYRRNPNAHRFRLSDDVNQYGEPRFRSMAQYVFGTNQKAQFLEGVVDKLLRDAGFTTFTNEKGLYVCIIAKK